MFKKITENTALVQNTGGGIVLSDVQSALEIIAATWEDGSYTRLIFLKENISEDFFQLKTGIAGEILQKFVNYGFRVAIVGNFDEYNSKSLNDFIFESNKGNIVCFTDTVENAVDKISV